MQAFSVDSFKSYIGRSIECIDVLSPRLVDHYRATLAPHLLAGSENDDLAPPGLHWCLTPPAASIAALGDDGHPVNDTLIPKSPELPRRMWAGGALQFIAPLQIGDCVRRYSTLADIAFKQGRSGPLCFASIDHEYSTARGVAIRERQQVVYRPAYRTSPDSKVQDQSVQTQGVPLRSDLAWNLNTSPILLLRYSALTFNSHRIHYDEHYAKSVEGYAGLLVHGPLQASVLMNLASTLAGRPLRDFRYSGLAPLIVGVPVCAEAALQTGGRIECWIRDEAGRRYMQATSN